MTIQRPSSYRIPHEPSSKQKHCISGHIIFCTDNVVVEGSDRVNFGTNRLHAVVLLSSRALKYFIFALHGNEMVDHLSSSP